MMRARELRRRIEDDGGFMATFPELFNYAKCLPIIAADEPIEDEPE